MVQSPGVRSDWLFWLPAQTTLVGRSGSPPTQGLGVGLTGRSPQYVKKTAWWCHRLTHPPAPDPEGENKENREGENKENQR